MNKLLRQSIAESSTNSYRSGWNQWIAFLAKLREQPTGEVDPYGPSEDDLLRYVASMTLAREGKPKGLAVRTVRSYLSAIAHYHAISGRDDPRSGLVRLGKLLTGLKRHRGVDSTPKRPITISLLKEMKKYIPTGTLEGATHWAALCMGVHGLFRLGELLPPAAEKRPLTHGDVRWVSEDHAVVTLRRSKTDPFGKGVAVNLFATGDATCPLTALKDVWARQFKANLPTGDDAPVFRNAAGIVDKKSVIALMKRVVALVAKEFPELGLVSKHFAGHSLRRGGATSLALRGVRESVLRMLGRWKSDAVNLYIEVPVDSLRHASHVMAMTPDAYRHADLAAAGSPCHVTDMVSDL